MPIPGQIGPSAPLNSVRQFTGTGAQVNWEFSFTDGYIDRSYVKVTVVAPDGTKTYPAFTFAGDATLNIVPAVAAGHDLYIYRDTPLDKPLVDFQDEAIINEVNLDLNARQAIHVAAEIEDRSLSVLLDLNTRAIKVPVGEVAPAMPSAASRANKFLAFGPNGELVAAASDAPGDSGLRTDLGEVGGASLVVTDNGDTVEEALTAIDADVTAVESKALRAANRRRSPRVKLWHSPAAMNNPLFMSVDCNGIDYVATLDHHKEVDWASTATGIIDVYVTKTGSDAADGLTPATAWASWHKVKTSAPDKARIHCLDDEIGYNSNYSGSANWGDRRVKIIGEGPSGKTWFTAWNESYTPAYLAWAASGAAYTSSASMAITTIKGLGDRKFLDRYGIPRAYKYVTSLALCQATPGSYNITGTTLAVRTLDGRVPDAKLLFCTSFANSNFTSNTHVTIENCGFAFSGGSGVVVNPVYFRPNDIVSQNTIRYALKGVVSFGGSGNAFSIYDCLLISLTDCAGGYCGLDVFNFSSFQATGIQCRWSTSYVSRCFGHDAGWAFSEALAHGNSVNLFTWHRSMHFYLIGCGGYNIPNAVIACVQGCFGMVFGFKAAETTATTGSMFQANYWQQRVVTAEGTAGNQLILIGCDSDADEAGKYVFADFSDNGTANSIGVIAVADWLGDIYPRTFPGTTVIDYETGLPFT